LNETCHCGLYINQENSHYAYIDFCDNDESLAYENKLELRYYNSKTLVNTRVNCMNNISKDNIDDKEWLNVASNTNGIFKCGRIVTDSSFNDETESSSYLISINDLVNLRYDIDFDEESKLKKLIRKIAIKINDKIENGSSNFGGLCGNFANSTCDNYLDNENKCEDDENVLYNYWK
jgi:hypothetical protein